MAQLRFILTLVISGILAIGLIRDTEYCVLFLGDDDNGNGSNGSVLFKPTRTTTISTSTTTTGAISSSSTTELSSLILPKRMIVVFGLESSGTKFVYRTLGTALNLTRVAGGEEYTDYYVTQGSNNTNNNNNIRMQYISLPMGKVTSVDDPMYHHQYEDLPILPVKIFNRCIVKTSSLSSSSSSSSSLSSPSTLFSSSSSLPSSLPTECSVFSSTTTAASSSSTLTSTLTTFASTLTSTLTSSTSSPPDPFSLPSRYFVNITSHLQWYRQQGVQVQPVVVVRDSTLHFQTIVRDHCPNQTAAYQQFKKGIALMQHAMQQEQHDNHNYNSNYNDRLVTVSYETLMTLRGRYLQQIYHSLGIDSTYLPTFQNGNAKYVYKIPKNMTKQLINE